jgi:type II secretory pathway pseudopilin PulG
MELKAIINKQRLSRKSGFSVLEAIVAMGVVGLLVMALYAGMTSAMLSVRLARENHRATQIMVEKMELLRLFTWDQLNTTNFVPPTFTASYVDDGTTNTSGLTYAGTVSITPYPAGKNYSDYIKIASLNMTWTSGGIVRTRELSTYVGRYGIQNYVLK